VSSNTSVVKVRWCLLALVPGKTASADGLFIWSLSRYIYDRCNLRQGVRTQASCAKYICANSPNLLVASAQQRMMQ